MLRGLIDTQPDLQIAWLELVGLLAQQKRVDDARQVIAEAQTKIKLPQEQVELVVGQCFEALGDLETAEKHFIEARDSKPDDVGLTRRWPRSTCARGMRPRRKSSRKSMRPRRNSSLSVCYRRQRRTKPSVNTLPGATGSSPRSSPLVARTGNFGRP